METPADPARAALAAELERLVERVRPWTPSRWEAAAHGVPGSRADVARLLVATLAAAGRTAGSGCPATATPPALALMAIADQLAVTGHDLLAADPDDALVRESLRAVLETRTALDGTPAPEGLLALTS